jgi:exodeoxyribonuclease III
MKIITWNINSVRLRIELLNRLVCIEKPNIICLQETKVHDDFFPYQYIKNLGFDYIYIEGQNSYNGVAIISNIPIQSSQSLKFAGKNDARHISVKLDSKLEVHNFYVPAGGDIPDPNVNPKFDHKLSFIDEMKLWFEQNRNIEDNIILVGDLNIAPLEKDVWSHKQLLSVVSHTPIEVEKLSKLQSSLNWQDVSRKFVPENESLYSWWSYRNRDWKKSNRGRRLDHIWVTPSLISKVENSYIIKETRDWERTSDHVPVVAIIQNY